MTSPFLWQGKPLTPRITKATQTPLFNGLMTPTNHRGAINVVGQEQGRIDTAKQQLTRGASR
jgi:hypothetical protein